jgi:hypothetical protein
VADRTYFLVVATNFTNTLGDTNDLSTLRGGSLMLLGFADALAKGLVDAFGAAKVEVISSGASELLLQCNNSDDADAVEAAIHDQLGKAIGPINPRHFTFAVARQSNNWPQGLNKTLRDFGTIRAALRAKVRIQQFRVPTVPLPEKSQRTWSKGAKPCELSGVFAADFTEGSAKVSASVAARKPYGRAQRAAFYADRLQEAGPAGIELAARLKRDNISFTNSLSDLSARDREVRTLGLPIGLRSKLAVLYLDGNGFGQALNEVANKPDGPARLSAWLRQKQAALLADILSFFVDQRELQIFDENKQRLRFETLLWGGDEMIFAFPAFAAWDLCHKIQSNLDQWRLPADLGGKRITHAAGLIFADRKMPVRVLRALAGDLGDLTKEGVKDANGLQIFALEGVDQPEGSLQAQRQTYFGMADDQKQAFQLVTQSQTWATTATLLTELKDMLPKASASRLAEQAIQMGLEQAHTKEGWQLWVRDELARNGATRAVATTLSSKLFPEQSKALGYSSKTRAMPLLTLLHLWDYIEPVSFGAEAGSAAA